MTRGAALLDVDGTLVDSSWIHTLAWSQALRAVGVEGVAMARIHPLVGMGADRLVEELLGRPVDGVSDAHHAAYERLRPDVRPLDGARELVRALHDRGLAVVLASSSKEDELEFLREVLDVDRWIAGATSSDDAETSKPSPDIFAAALRVAEVDARRAAVVGDTRWDVEAANGLGLATVAVLTGGGRPGELRAAGAAEVHEDPAALLAALDDSLLTRLTHPTQPVSEGVVGEGAPMDAPRDTVDEAVDGVEQLLAPDDDTAAGRDMAADDDPAEGEEDDDVGLPPAGDDPMDGAAPTG